MAAPPSVGGLTFVGWQEPIGCGGVAVYPGDIIIAEPKAMVGFAGPRVIKETTHQDLPEGFQTAEFLEAHGLIDMIVPRKRMRATLVESLDPDTVLVLGDTAYDAATADELKGYDASWGRFLDRTRARGIERGDGGLGGDMETVEIAQIAARGFGNHRPGRRPEVPRRPLLESGIDLPDGIGVADANRPLDDAVFVELIRWEVAQVVGYTSGTPTRSRGRR